jgi:hypothetical protein
LQSVNNAWDFAMLEEEFKHAIHSKHRGMLTNGVVLNHNNAGFHTVAATIEMVQKLKI